MPLAPKTRDLMLRALLGRDGGLWIGLLTRMPNDDGVGAEEPSRDYERQPAQFETPKNGMAPLAGDVLWPRVTSNSVDEVVLGWGAYDSPDAETPLFWEMNDQTHEYKAGVAWRYFAGDIGIVLR